MDEIDLIATCMCCLDELHTRSTLIVSRLECIDSRRFIVREDDIGIGDLGIFEIIPTRLELIQFTILLRCHRILECISEDDEIIRKSIFCIGCDIGKLDNSFFWIREIHLLDFTPVFRD